MIETHSLITSLQQNVRQIGLHLEDLDIYLFGSFGKSPSPADVDLLLVYDEKKLSIPEILKIRKTLYLNQKNISNLPLDISILNITEEQETNFILNEKAIQLVLM